MITDRLKEQKPPEDKELVQGRVRRSLKRDVEEHLTVTWPEFLEACMEEYLDEIRSKK